MYIAGINVGWIKLHNEPWNLKGFQNLFYILGCVIHATTDYVDNNIAHINNAIMIDCSHPQTGKSLEVSYKQRYGSGCVCIWSAKDERYSHNTL